jgi:hypothetical protein
MSAHDTDDRSSSTTVDKKPQAATHALQTKATRALPKSATTLSLRTISMLLGYALAGAAIAALGMTFGREKALIHTLIGNVSVLSVLDLFLLPLHFFLVILLHELGHLAGGMARGMRFLLLIVGPLRLRRTVSGLKLDWFLRGDTFSGLASAMPHVNRSTPRDFLALILGGPLTSLMVAAIAFSLAIALDGRWAVHAAILGALSALIFAATAIPMRAGGFMSDGMQALELLRGGSAVEQRTTLIAAYAEGLAGVRPRDRNPALLERGLALSGKEPLRDVSLWWMAYQVALDRRELDIAGQWLDRVAEGFDGYPAGFRQALACDVAYFAARYRHDLLAATAWYARAKGGMVEAPSRALTEAAIALLRGNSNAALVALDLAERKLGEMSDLGSIPFLRDEIMALRTDAEAARTSAGGR